LSTEFEDPIILPDGRQLLTLKDAADYITKLPKKESHLPEWQTAIEVLLVSRGGPTMMARNAKEHHWAKRKLRETSDLSLGGAA
jgi:hypothetical protein